MRVIVRSEHMSDRWFEFFRSELFPAGIALFLVLVGILMNQFGDGPLGERVYTFGSGILARSLGTAMSMAPKTQTVTRTNNIN